MTTKTDKKAVLEDVKIQPLTEIHSKFHTEGQLEDIRAGPRVLVVDDDPLVLYAVKSMLTHLSCKVTTATSGSQAVDIISNSNRLGSMDCIELAILDANMPAMNGYETAAALLMRMNKYEIVPLHLVCLSAQDSEAHIELCKQSGMELISNVSCLTRS